MKPGEGLAQVLDKDENWGRAGNFLTSSIPSGIVILDCWHYVSGLGLCMDNRSNILSCALRLFATRGYDAVGVQEIVEAAGITKPTLYHYFGSKQGLLDALLKEYFDQLYREVKVGLGLPQRFASYPQSSGEDLFRLCKPKQDVLQAATCPMVCAAGERCFQSRVPIES